MIRCCVWGVLVHCFVVAAGCGSGSESGGDAAPLDGPYCCAVLSHGMDCGYNIRSSGTLPKERYAAAEAGAESLCEDIFNDIINEGATSCEERSPVDHFSMCLEDPGIGRRRHTASLEPVDWQIPAEFPQLDEQESRVVEFQLGGFMEQR